MWIITNINQLLTANEPLNADERLDKFHPFILRSNSKSSLWKRDPANQVIHEY